MTKDQKLKDLANGNIFCNQTNLVEALLELSPELIDDVENLYPPFVPGKKEIVCFKCGEVRERIDRETELCRECFQEENTAREILEWHLVSKYLAEELVRQGETVFNHYGCYWWGRPRAGQSIYMDSVFQDIARKYGVIV